MNITHLEHSLIALGIQLLLWPLLGPVAAGCIAVAIFIGREIAQHEYKLATKWGWIYGQPMPVKWYEGFTTGWSKDSILDILFPIICTGVIAWIFQ